MNKYTDIQRNSDELSNLQSSLIVTLSLIYRVKRKQIENNSKTFPFVAQEKVFNEKFRKTKLFSLK